MSHYKDDVFSLNDSNFGDFVDRIYPVELEIKDTTDTDRSASYVDLHQEIYNEGRLRTKLYDKRDDLNFPIANFLFICSNIPAASAYGVYISQLIQYSRSFGDHGYVSLVVSTSQSFPHSWLITGFVTRVTRWVTLVEQFLLTLPEPLISPPNCSGVHVAWSLVFCVVFVDCLSFSFVHCVVCPSLILITLLISSTSF